MLQVTFLSCANDVVSCGFDFSGHSKEFSCRKKLYTDPTDAYHNMKNICYQLIVGVNRLRFIGVLVIDTVILPKFGIDQGM